MFHTTLASGAPGFPPLAASAVLADESRSPLPDLATNRGLNDKEAPLGAAAGVAVLSPSLDGVAVALAARNFLFTDTGLNDANFFTVDAVRTWPFPSASIFEVSAFEASVSDPPLTLTSAEMTFGSTSSVSCLLSSLSLVPFTMGKSEESSCVVVSTVF